MRYLFWRSKRSFWRLYYRHKTPSTMSEVIVALARIRGLKLIRIKTVSLDPCDMRGAL